MYGIPSARAALLTATVILSASPAFAWRASAADSETFERRARIAQELQSALEEVSIATESTAAWNTLRLELAATSAQRALGSDSRIAQLLERAIVESRSVAPKASVNVLTAELEQAIDALQFRVLSEAPLPVGFPGPTPLEDIEVKTYPKYRLAITSMGRRGQNTAFFKLFNHIKSNDIAMTAPVEMQYTDDGETAVTMAFLYEEPDMGELGADGSVAVIDKEPMTVVSIGLRGYESRTRVLDAARTLEAFVANDPSIEVSGEVRLMGYNSPMVSEAQRFFEVQIPVDVSTRDVERTVPESTGEERNAPISERL